MAANPLLLNLSSSGSSPSKKIDTSPPPPVVSPPPGGNKSNATANTLLQSILSPNPTPKAQSKPASNDQQNISPDLSSPIKSSSQDTLAPAQSPKPSTSRTPIASSRTASASANDLLALLSGTGKVQPSSEEDEGDLSFHEQTPRARLQPIGTPPGQSSRKNSSKSPAPTMFDSANLFDMLRQPRDNGKASAPPASMPQSKDFAAEDTKGLTLQPVKAMPRVAQPVKTAYTIKRKLHASHHLSGLHASAGFEDSISDGLDAMEVDGVQHFTLDLNSPQPAGLNSLYPAKLEITPVSLLTTTFTPSSFVNEEDEQSSLARWPGQRVAGMGGNIAMYVMSKGRVRVIDLVSGDRTLARADSTIRSVFTPEKQRPGYLQDDQRNFAAITEKGGLCVWSLKKDFGQGQGDAPLTLHLFAESGKTFLSAQWLPKREDTRMLVLQDDGLLALLSLPEGEDEYKKTGTPLSWSQCPKTIIAELHGEEYRPVGIAVSSDGSLAASIQIASGEMRLRLLPLFDQQSRNTQTTVPLPSLTQLGCSNVSFTTFVDNGEDKLPHGLIIGYDDNQVIALIDPTTGSLKQLYRFKAPGSSFSLAAWHSATSSLLLCCSIRSSIFSLRIRFAPLPSIDPHVIANEAGLQAGQSVDHAHEVLHRIKHKALPCSTLISQPALRECGLPEPYVSFALDDTTPDQKSVRLIATHLGGIHAVSIPEEALVQRVDDAVQQDSKEVEGVKQSNGGDTTRMAVEDVKLASQGNIDVIESVAETTSASESKTEANRVDPSITRAATPPVIATPIAPSSQKKKAASGTQGESKKKSQQSPRAPKEAKVDKPALPNVSSTSNDSSGEMHVSNDVNNSTDEIKTLFAALEDRLVSRLQGPSSTSADTGVDAARALADQLTPKMSAIIHDVLGLQLQAAVDSAVTRCLPNELHNVLSRPELSNHLTRSITSSILPPIQKTAMDVVSRVLAPHFETIMSEMANRTEARIGMELTGIRKDIITEQSKALLETEANLREITMQMGAMTRSLGMLTLQNKKLEKALETMQIEVATRASALPLSNGASNPHHDAVSVPITYGQSPATPSSFTALPSARNVSLPYSPQHAPPSATFQRRRQPSYHAAQLPSAPTPPIPTPAPAPVPATNIQQFTQLSPPGMSSQEVEDILLSSLSSPNIDADPAPLLSSLSHIATQCGSPVSALWNKTADASSLGKSRISQAVILTLLGRLIKSLRLSAEQQQQGNGATPFLSVEFAVPWIEACAAALDRNDEVIARFYNHIRPEMIDNLIQCHRLLKSRAYWWTNDRLDFGVLRFIQ